MKTLKVQQLGLGSSYSWANNIIDKLIDVFSNYDCGTLYVEQEVFEILLKLFHSKMDGFIIFLVCVAYSGKNCPKDICFPGKYDSEYNKYIYLFDREFNSNFQPGTLKPILKLFVDHEGAGRQFFNAILESQGLDNIHQDMIDTFFELELFDTLQSAAIKSLSDRYVNELIKLGHFDTTTNKYYNDYFRAGNLMSIKVHVEKNGVNSITEYYGPPSTVLFYARTREIAHFLLKNGADPTTLVRKTCGYSSSDIDIPHISVIRWCLEYDISIKNIITTQLILDEDIYGHLDHKSHQKYLEYARRTELDYIKILRDFNYIIPQNLLEKHSESYVTRGALITYSFLKCDKDEKLSPKYLRWNIITHKHFDHNIKDKVKTILLCFNRICRIPKDIRNLILEEIFFEN